MKGNCELTRGDIAVSEIESDGRYINVYIETWFDVDKKFGLDTASDDDTWLNMYGNYDPYNDDLWVQYEIVSGDGSECCDYEEITEDEAKLIKEMIAEKIREDYNKTPQEFCEEYYGEDADIGGERA